MNKDVLVGREGVPLFLVRYTVNVDEGRVRIGHPISCMCDWYVLVRVGVQFR